MQKYQVKNLIRTLENAIEVCYGVDYDCEKNDPANVEKTAPFACGYSRTAMMTVVKELREVL
jgi:hypothetical protein